MGCNDPDVNTTHTESPPLVLPWALLMEFPAPWSSPLSSQCRSLAFSIIRHSAVL